MVGDQKPKHKAEAIERASPKCAKIVPCALAAPSTITLLSLPICAGRRCVGGQLARSSRGERVVGIPLLHRGTPLVRLPWERFAEGLAGARKRENIHGHHSLDREVGHGVEHNSQWLDHPRLGVFADLWDLHAVVLVVKPSHHSGGKRFVDAFVDRRPGHAEGALNLRWRVALRPCTWPRTFHSAT